MMDKITSYELGVYKIPCKIESDSKLSCWNIESQRHWTYQVTIRFSESLNTRLVDKGHRQI